MLATGLQLAYSMLATADFIVHQLRVGSGPSTRGHNMSNIHCSQIFSCYLPYLKHLPTVLNSSMAKLFHVRGKRTLLHHRCCVVYICTSYNSYPWQGLQACRKICYLPLARITVGKSLFTTFSCSSVCVYYLPTALLQLLHPCMAAGLSLWSC